MKQFFKLTKNLVAIGIALVFFVWLFGVNSLSLQQVYLPLLDLPPALWGVVVLGLLSTYVLRGWRVAYEFRAYEDMTFLRCVKIVLWHNATLNLLPFRSGELVFPLLLHKVARVPVLSAVTSLIYLRFQDACVVVMIAIFVWPNLDVLTRLLLLLSLILFAVMFQKWAQSTSSWQNSSWLLKRRLANMREALASGSPNARLNWALTAVNWSIKISIQAILYVNLIHLDFSVGVLATLSSEFAALLPIQGLAGLGTFEASSAMVIRSAGITWVESLQVAAQVHVVMLTSALFWALLSMFVIPLVKQKN